MHKHSIADARRNLSTLMMKSSGMVATCGLEET
jgi:hypothetical protein